MSKADWTDSIGSITHVLQQFGEAMYRFTPSIQPRSGNSPIKLNAHHVCIGLSVVKGRICMALRTVYVTAAAYVRHDYLDAASVTTFERCTLLLTRSYLVLYRITIVELSG